MKKYSISLTIKEMQIKTTLKFQCISVTTLIKRTTTTTKNPTNAGEDAEKKGTLLYTAGGNVN
jgi:hypothetical protein